MKWLYGELVILEKHYPHKTSKELQKLLPRHTIFAIRSKGYKLGYKKTEETLNRSRGFRKGKKMWKLRKKHAGGRPKSWSHPVGHISERKTSYGAIVKKIKTKGGWKALHKVKWVELHGEIPKGMLLRAKGSTLNPEPDNWELITRAENLKRNSERKKMERKREYKKLKEAFGFGF